MSKIDVVCGVGCNHRGGCGGAGARARARPFLKFLRKEKNGEDVSCGTEREMTGLWACCESLMMF